MAERWQQWYPHHIDNWQGSANVQALSDLAYRAVHNLLMDMWKQEDCSLPNEDRDLAKRSRVFGRWVECRDEVMEYFTCAEGRITHPVLRKEWDAARGTFEKKWGPTLTPDELREKRSAAGKAGAAKKWENYGKDMANDGKPMANAIDANGKGMAKAWLTDTGTSTSTETSTETKAKTKAKSAASAFVLPDWIDSGVWHGYEEMRRKIRKPMTDDARRLVVKKLAVFDGNGSDPMAVLNQSIENSWQGIFELKQPGGNANGNGNYKSKTESSIDAACEAIRIINARGADCDGADEARYTPASQAGYGGLPRLGSGSGLF